MDLKSYLKSEGLSIEEAAIKYKISYHKLYRHCLGGQIGLKTAIRLQHRTGGAVSLTDMLPKELCKELFDE